MKNASATNSSKSAPIKRDYIPGTLPKRHHTVLAEVLASMLESNTLTGLNSVFAQNTTRLSAVIHTLSKHYSWHIERRAVKTSTNDGRIVLITAYRLPQATIAQALEMDARAWIDDVKTARAKQRQQVNKCKSYASRNQLCQMGNA